MKCKKCGEEYTSFGSIDPKLSNVFKTNCDCEAVDVVVDGVFDRNCFCCGQPMRWADRQEFVLCIPQCNCWEVNEIKVKET